jgi:hypothetical protein
MSKLFVPVLQAQDGSFYGTDGAGDMVRLSQYGNVIWSVPNDSPKIATADGGVIGFSGITYDSQGRATGLSGKCPGDEELAGAQERRAGESMADEAAHLWALAELVSAAPRDPNDEDILAAAE